jgi:competence protein ComEA
VLIAALAMATAAGWVVWLVRPPETGAPIAAPQLLIDVNTAPIGVLNALPGIGPARAQAIVDERSKRPFESLQDLDRRVVGIGPATIRALTPFLQFRNPP